MKKIKKYIVLFAVAVIAAFGMYIFIGFKSSNEAKITSSAVVDKIRDISELNTVEMYFNEIVDFKDAKKFKNWTIPFTTKSFLFTANARVKAGVDLTGMTQEDVRIDKKKITVILPQPAITSKEILDAKTYDEKDGLFNEITNDDTLKVIDAFEEQLEKQAIDSGILDKARDNAKNTIEKWLSLLNFDEIDIQFKEADTK